MGDYLPQLASIDESCEWLVEQTCETWNLQRLLEAGLMPWVWLDYSPEAPPELFGGRHEGFLAPFVFNNDCGRIGIDRMNALMTMTRAPDGRLVNFAPGLSFDLVALRFKRDDIEHLAQKTSPTATASADGAGLADFSWQQALVLLGPSINAKTRANGWPSVFSPAQIAALQFPWPADKSERSRARSDQLSLARALEAAITNGVLEASQWRTMVDVVETRSYRRSNSLITREKVKTGEREQNLNGISRDAAQAFLVANQLEPSEHIRAWLRPLEDEQDEKGDAVPETLTAMKLKAVREALGRKYPKLDAAMNRGEKWAKACRVPQAQSPDGNGGWYWLERVEAECRARYGASVSVAPAGLDMASQLVRIAK